MVKPKFEAVNNWRLLEAMFALGQKRTKRRRKKCGKKLGGNRGSVISAKARAAGRAVAPTIAELQRQGVTSLRRIAAELNARKIPTAAGGEWSARRLAAPWCGSSPRQGSSLCRFPPKPAYPNYLGNQQ